MQMLPAIIEKSEYAKQWKSDACEIKRQQGYEWMCDQIADLNPQKILEIGCGTGESTLSLYNRFRARIISVEENSFCIEKTVNLLNKQGVDNEAIIRMDYSGLPNGQHVIEVSTDSIVADKQVSLVHGDVLLNDIKMRSFLSAQGPFDLVVIWMMGTIRMRESCANLNGLARTSAREYTLLVQNRTYELADVLLRPGGKLQVVDRGEALATKALYDAAINSHKEQASVTDLKVEGATWKEYKLAGTNRITLVPSIQVDRKWHPLSWISIVSSKP